MEPLRKASEAPVPYRDRSVTFLRIRGPLIEQTHTVEGKRQMLEAHQEGDILLLAWTGRRRTDIFEVDDLPAARQALT